MNIDNARLRPHLREHDHLEHRDRHHRVHVTPMAATTPSWVADPGDLRGIPVIARGVGGTSPHTQPEQETIHRLTRLTKRQ